MSTRQERRLALPEEMEQICRFIGIDPTELAEMWIGPDWVDVKLHGKIEKCTVNVTAMVNE